MPYVLVTMVTVANQSAGEYRTEEVAVNPGDRPSPLSSVHRFRKNGEAVTMLVRARSAVALDQRRLTHSELN
jgi:hypothetical protein